MPPARNQLVQVRRASMVNSNPWNTAGNRSRKRRSTMFCKRVIQVDKTAGTIHDDIAGPPCECSRITTSCREARHFVYTACATMESTKIRESAGLRISRQVSFDKTPAHEPVRRLRSQRDKWGYRSLG